MLKFFFFSCSFVLGFIILLTVVFVVGVAEIVTVLSRFSPWGLIPLILLTIAVHLISAVKWQYILRVMGYKVAFAPILKIWLAGYTISYLTPVVYIGGEFFRGHILKERHNVPWKKSLASMGVDRISEAIVWISVIFLGALVFLMHPTAPVFSKTVSASILAILFLGGVFGIILIFIFRRKSMIYALILKPFGLKQSKSVNFLYEIERDFLDFFAVRHRKNLAWVLEISALKYVLLWLRNLFLLYYLVGVLSVSGSIIALGFSYLAYIAPIPAALGVQEAILSSVFSDSGFTAGTGAGVTFLLRFAEMIMLGVGIYYVLKWGLGKIIFSAIKLVKNAGVYLQ